MSSLQIFEGILVGVATMIMVGWMAWVSKLLISVQNTVSGTEGRIRALEVEAKSFKGFMDEIAPRQVEVS